MLKIDKLYVAFDEEVIFDNFSMHIKNGEKVAVTGKSGKGKSTLLNILGGFISGFKGKIIIDNTELNENNIYTIRKKTAWLPQELSVNFKTVNELFTAPFKFAGNRLATPSEERISELFKSFDLDKSLLQKNIKEISGGQKQRIILAGCILLNKPILLLDEPTSALDENIKQRITDYILNLKDITVIAATHDKYWIEKSDREIKL